MTKTHRESPAHNNEKSLVSREEELTAAEKCSVRQETGNALAGLKQKVECSGIEYKRQLEQNIDSVIDQLPKGIGSRKQRELLRTKLKIAIKPKYTADGKISTKEWQKIYLKMPLHLKDTFRIRDGADVMHLIYPEKKISDFLDLMEDEKLKSMLEDKTTKEALVYALDNLYLSSSPENLLDFCELQAKHPDFAEKLRSPEVRAIFQFAEQHFRMDEKLSTDNIIDLIKLSLRDGLGLVQKLVNEYGFSREALEHVGSENEFESVNFEFLAILAKNNGIEFLDCLKKRWGLSRVLWYDEWQLGRVPGVNLDTIAVVAESGGEEFLRSLQKKTGTNYPYRDFLRLAQEYAEPDEFTSPRRFTAPALSEMKTYPVSTGFLKAKEKESGYSLDVNDHYLLHYMEENNVRLDKVDLGKGLDAWMKGRKTYTPRNTEAMMKNGGLMRTEIHDYNEIDALNLYRINLITKSLQRPEVKKALKDMVIRDRKDKTSEYGGFIAFDSSGQVNFVEKSPAQKKGDGIYKAPFYRRAFPGIGDFHLHAHEAAYESHSAPSGSDRHGANYYGGFRILVTSVYEKRGTMGINVDAFFVDPVTRKDVVVDLGVVEL